MSVELSVVVLSWNTRELLRECLDGLRDAMDGLSVEIVVIDNASEDGSADMVAESYPEVILERNPDNRGYAIGVNQGIRLSTGEKICLLGSDTRMRAGTLLTLCQFLDAHPGVGAVAPPLLNDDGTYQSACMRFPTLKTALWWDTPLEHFWPESRELRRYKMEDWDHTGSRDVDQPPGTCFMVLRAVVEDVGFMDERLWLFFNDVDWSMRIRQAGYAIWYVEAPGVYHKEGGSTRKYTDFAAEWHRNRVSFYKKHFNLLGSLLTKAVVVYVALRQCVRIKRHVPFGKEYKDHCRMVLGQMWRVLHV